MAKNGLLAGTKRVDIFTGSTETEGGTQVSNSNPLPVTSVSHTSTDLDGGGKTSVGTTAVEVTFSGTTESIVIRADRNNTGLLFVGKSNVTNLGANSITYLEAGDSITLDYDDVDNAVYVVASVISQFFYKGASL